MQTKVKTRISLSEIWHAYQLALSKVNSTPHAPTGIGNGTATSTHTYDNNGNLTSAGVWTYAYDYRNRLTSAGNGLATSTYGYDQNGQRVKITDGTTGLVNLYPTKYYNAEYDGGSNIKKQTSHSFAGDILLTTLETKTLDFANYGTCTIPSSGDFTLTSSWGNGDSHHCLIKIMV